MKVILDLLHPAHLNFFQNAMRELGNDGVEFNIIYRSRAKFKSILEHDLPDKPALEIGKHHKAPPAKFFALINREFQILKYLKHSEFDLAAGIAGFYVSLPAKIRARKSVSFTDDWEYKTTYHLSKDLSDYLVTPKLIPGKGSNILRYNGYKELAYLHPKYYRPKSKIVTADGMTPGKYVFVRLVSPVALNYLKVTEGNLKKLFEDISNKGYEIALSTEGAEQGEPYADICHVLRSPVKDLHSWMANAALTITFGDTIARESCLLGTPAIYRGGREMVINSELISMGCLKKIDKPEGVMPEVKKLLDSDSKKHTGKQVKDAISSGKWIDTTSAIIDIFNGILKDNNELINKYRN